LTTWTVKKIQGMMANSSSDESSMTRGGRSRILFSRNHVGSILGLRSASATGALFQTLRFLPPSPSEPEEMTRPSLILLPTFLHWEAPEIAGVSARLAASSTASPPRIDEERIRRARSSSEEEQSSLWEKEGTRRLRGLLPLVSDGLQCSVRG
jgi:hypothetical protein